MQGYYYPQRPDNTFQAHLDWFNTANQWEYPYVSRPEYSIEGTPEQLQWYKEQRLKQLLYHIERVVLFRCLPLYKKEIDGRSKMWSAEVPLELWSVLQEEFKAQGAHVSEKKIKYPDHGFTRVEKQITLSWNKGYLPKLANEFWWFKKWIDPISFIQHRAYVKTFALVYNSWTCLLRVHFTYSTWIYNYVENKWEYV